MTFPRRVSVTSFLLLASAISSAALLAGCGPTDTPKSDAQLQQEIVVHMRSLILDEIQGLSTAARDLQAAAPSQLSGWDPAGDGITAMAAMREAWKRTRDHWERVEGTLSPLFADLDGALDSRYEDVLQQLGGDDNPFDHDGMTGMHAVERILFAPGPQDVVDYEATLPGYWLAALPGTDQQAADFKVGLCQRLIEDTQSLMTGWQSRPIDLGVVFSGLTGLLSAQLEKVSLAAEQKEESRYSQTTMLDLRSNLAGTRAIYKLFVPWLATKNYGSALDHSATTAFDALEQTYSDVAGNDIPAPPATWAASPNSAENLRSPFGVLYLGVSQAVDPSRSGSVVDSMNAVARTLNLPEFTGQN